MAKRIYVVRVVDDELKRYEEGEEMRPDRQSRCAALSGFLESLRYAHLVHIFKGGYDLMPPRSIIDTELWAKMNAERMRTFGYNAVVAPAQ